ncbi:MAG: AAA family ATPase [Actinomycetes bacterium]
MSLNDLFAAERKRLGLDNPPPTTSPTAPPRLSLVDSGDPRADRWLQIKTDAQIADLAAMTPDSGRNAALNAIAYSLGRFVPRWLEENDLRDRLMVACHTNGLVAEDGARQCEATIRSGLSKGMLEPRDPPISEADSLTGLVVGPIVTAPSTPSGTTSATDGSSALDIAFDPLTGEVLEAPQPALDATDAAAVASPGLERTSWWPRDIAGMLSGDIPPEPEPVFLARSDGRRLFYAGKINGLIGESESGKTWVALLAVLQALQEGESVLYLDFEDTDRAILARLHLMGATSEQLRRFAYIGPDEHLGLVQSRDLSEYLALAKPSLIVLDGYNAAMTMLGLNLIDNNDIYRFALTLLRPLKKTGAAVVTIDHVTKSKEGRGAFAIGGQAKRSDVDGCAIGVEVITPFGVGMKGKLRLTVSKDRPGQVRAVSSGAKNAGLAIIDSSSGDSTRVWIEAPDTRPIEQRGPFRPTGLMQKVSRYLERCAGEASGKTIETEVGGKAEYVRTALQLLVAEGFVTASAGPRGATLHTFARPYNEADDPTSSPRPDLVPTSSRDEVEVPNRPRPSSPPAMGGRGRGQGTGSETTSKTADLVPGDEDDREDWWQR